MFQTGFLFLDTISKRNKKSFLTNNFCSICQFCDLYTINCVSCAFMMQKHLSLCKDCLPARYHLIYHIFIPSSHAFLIHLSFILNLTCATRTRHLLIMITNNHNAFIDLGMRFFLVCFPFLSVNQLHLGGSDECPQSIISRRIK